MIEFKKGWFAHIDPIPKKDIERNWQKSELSKTDNMLQPDRTNAQAILVYRLALRAYNNHEDFPNGTRPKLP